MRLPRLITFASVLATAACSGGGDGDGDGDGDATPTAFRIDTLNLRDPHTFLNGSVDITGSVDDAIADGITMDADTPADGNLDLNLLVVHLPLAQGAPTTSMQVVFADCTAPATSTSCTKPASSMAMTVNATNNASGVCLEPAAGSTSDFDPPVANTMGPCFVAEPSTFDVALGSIILEMQDAQVAATYSGDPATSATGGLIKGFVTQATADAAIIPDSVPIVNGMAVSALLRDEDKDPGPGGADGWWFYLNFTATVVPYTP